MAKKNVKNGTERTRIVTAKITIIERDDLNDISASMTKECKKAYMAKRIKEALNADDVQVSNVQDFLMAK